MAQRRTVVITRDVANTLRTELGATVVANPCTRQGRIEKRRMDIASSQPFGIDHLVSAREPRRGRSLPQSTRALHRESDSQLLRLMI